MKNSKRRFGCWAWGLSFLLVVLLLLGYGVYHFFYSLDALPTGTLLQQDDSPDHRYTLNIYQCNGGATVDFAVRGELVDHQKHNQTYTIYWKYHQNNATVLWEDNHTVIINGVRLDVRSQVYDYRYDQP